MKKIAYIELDTHAEIAANFMELMQDSDEFSVDYYFSEKIRGQIGEYGKNIITAESSDLLILLKKEKYELVIIGTVHRYFGVFREICQDFNTAIIAHNLNFSRISKFQLLKNIFKKDFKYRLKLLLKENLLSAPDVFNEAKNLLVLDENLVQENLKYLPLFFNKFNEKPESENFTIIIPGAVSQERRDYKGILKKLTELRRSDMLVEEKSNPQKELRRSDMLVESAKTTDEELRRSDTSVETPKIQIIFLGKAKHEELQWLQNFEKNQPKNIQIHYFTEKIPQPIFDEWMKKSNILWCPIQRKTEFFSNPEIYGKTKMSGNIGDAIKYGKMAFFPENYDSDLPFILKENPLEIFKFNNEISHDFQEKFNKEKIRTELETVLKPLV